jgi:hypothetical protein
MISEIDIYTLLQFVVGAFSLILFAVSITAFKKSGSRRLLMVSAAFFLYFVKVLLLNVDVFIPDLQNVPVDLMSIIFDFLILLLFFVAIISKDKVSEKE